MKRIGLMAAGAATVAVAGLAITHYPDLRTAFVPGPALVKATPAPANADHRAMAIQVTQPIAASTVKPDEPIELPPQVAVATVAAATPEVKSSQKAAEPLPPAEEKAQPLAIEAKAAEAPLAPPAPPAPPIISLVAKVDLATQRLTVIEHGQTKFTWIVSSGAKGFDTPRGNFQPQWMAKDWYSRKYDNAPMPHSVFFKDGAAIHATMNPGSLGTPASHGCVRLSKVNAAIFFSMVQRHGMKHTRIHVFGNPRHAPDAVARNRGEPNRVSQARIYPPLHAVSYGSGAYGAAVARPSYGQQPAYRPVPLRVVQYGNRTQ